MTHPICPWCDEPVTPYDRRDPNHRHQPTHFECGLRSVVGGVNHQRHTCSCCGGTDDPDPPNVTRRVAAQMAANYFFNTHPIE